MSMWHVEDNKIILLKCSFKKPVHKENDRCVKVKYIPDNISINILLHWWMSSSLHCWTTKCYLQE